MMRERMLDSLAEAQYAPRRRGVCVCLGGKVSERRPLEIFSRPIRIILTSHPHHSVSTAIRRRPCYRSNLRRDPVTAAAGCCLAWCRRGDKDCRPDAQLSARINLVAGL